MSPCHSLLIGNIEVAISEDKLMSQERTMQNLPAVGSEPPTVDAVLLAVCES